jgi:hypothetical protein
MMWAVLLTIVGLVCGCNIRERLDGAGVRDDIDEIRNAEKRFHEQTGRYGSFVDLQDANLVNAALADGEDSAHLFDLRVVDGGYQLRVRQIVVPNQTPSRFEISYYLDQTGTIRASSDPNRPADTKSYPVD